MYKITSGKNYAIRWTQNFNVMDIKITVVLRGNMPQIRKRTDEEQLVKIRYLK